MKMLTSKIQYKNFEAGEFIDERERTYEETIELIDNFPWNSEREQIVIDLTNPSVTINGINNDFLKLSVYYNGRYVLHYFNNDQILFSKSFSALCDSYGYINNYFDETFNTANFKKENTLFQNNAKHFITRDFTFAFSAKLASKFFFSTTAFYFLLSLVFFLSLFFSDKMHFTPISLIIIVPLLFFLGGWFNLIIFINFYFHSKGKVLIMSKGNDRFCYGDKSMPVEFNKKDILHYKIIQSGSRKSPVSGFAITEIAFKDGSLLSISNLLMNVFELKNKLFEYPKIEKNSIPFF